MSTDIINVAPNFYGMSMVPKDSWKEYGFALLTIAGSDGEVSDPELEWLTIECSEELNVEEDIVAEWSRPACGCCFLDELCGSASVSSGF